MWWPQFAPLSMLKTKYTALKLDHFCCVSYVYSLMLNTRKKSLDTLSQTFVALHMCNLNITTRIDAGWLSISARLWCKHLRNWGSLHGWDKRFHFSLQHPYWFWGPPNFLSISYLGGWSMKVSTHFNLVLKLGMCGVIHLLLHTSSWRGA